MAVLVVDIEGIRPAGGGRHKWCWTAWRNGHRVAESCHWQASAARAEELVRSILQAPIELRVWRSGDLVKSIVIEKEEVQSDASV